MRFSSVKNVLASQPLRLPSLFMNLLSINPMLIKACFLNDSQHSYEAVIIA
jgi:hypothetical protein